MKELEKQKLDRLVFLRKQAGLTQDEVSAKMKMTRSSYSLIESGKIKLSDFHLRVLEKDFGFDKNYILNGDPIEDMGKSTTAKHTKTNEIPQWKDMMEMVFNMANDINFLKKEIMSIKGNLNFNSGEQKQGREVPMYLKEGEKAPLKKVA